MKRFNAFASTLRINTLLCCGAAVLLSACGGNIDTGSEQLSASAASVSTDAGTAAAGANAPAATVAPVEPVAEAVAAAGNEAAVAASNEALASNQAAAGSNEGATTAGTPGAAPQAADVNAQAFELTGYDSSSLQAQAGQQDAGANDQAPIRQ